MTTPCQSCELLRKMGADLLAERDEARAELDREMDHSQDLAKRVERLLAQNHRLREAATEAIKCRRFLPKDKRPAYQGLCDGCADELSRALEDKT